MKLAKLYQLPTPEPQLPAPHVPLVNALQNLLDLAKTGELQGVIFTSVTSQNDVLDGWQFAPAYHNTIQTVGAIEALKYEYQFSNVKL